MKLHFAILLILGVLLQLGLSLPLHEAAHDLGLHILHTFSPDVSIGDLLVGSKNQLIATASNKNVLYVLSPTADHDVQDVVVQDVTSLYGMTETEPGVFTFVAGNYSDGMAVRDSFGLYQVLISDTPAATPALVKLPGPLSEQFILADGRDIFGHKEAERKVGEDANTFPAPVAAKSGTGLNANTLFLATETDSSKGSYVIALKLGLLAKRGACDHLFSSYCLKRKQDGEWKWKRDDTGDWEWSRRRFTLAFASHPDLVRRNDNGDWEWRRSDNGDWEWKRSDDGDWEWKRSDNGDWEWKSASARPRQEGHPGVLRRSDNGDWEWKRSDNGDWEWRRSDNGDWEWKRSDNGDWEWRSAAVKPRQDGHPGVLRRSDSGDWEWKRSDNGDWEWRRSDNGDWEWKSASVNPRQEGHPGVLREDNGDWEWKSASVKPRQEGHPGVLREDNGDWEWKRDDNGDWEWKSASVRPRQDGHPGVLREDNGDWEWKRDDNGDWEWKLAGA